MRRVGGGRHGLALDARQQQIDGVGAQGIDRRRHRGQAIAHQFEPVGVAIADHRHIGRARQAQAAQRLERADGQARAADDQRGGRLGAAHQAVHGAMGELDPRRADGGQAGVQPGLAHGAAETGQAVFAQAQVRGGADIGDAPVAVVDQVLGGGARGGPFVDHHRFGGHRRVLADQLDGAHALEQGDGLGLGLDGGRDDHAGRARHHERAQVVELALGVVLGDAQRQLEAARHRRVGHDLGHGRVEIVLDVGHDQPDHRAVRRAHVLRRAVGHVAHGLRRLAHAGLGGGADLGMVGQRARHRGMRQLQAGRDVLDGDVGARRYASHG
ncbi:Uncharacterised protein [Bordetella pertussis]|nr:Uncharacterised protein [Bordetella pertussis]